MAQQPGFSWWRHAAWSCVALLVAPLASADWLVTVGGQRIETAGAWQIRGKQVVFTAKNGTLSSIRLAEIDLAATERANLPEPAPAAEPAAPPEVKKKPVLVLTDKDVARARPPAAAPEAQEPAGGQAGTPGGSAASPPAASGPRTEPVTLVSWSTIEKDPTLGVEIMGTVRNGSADIVTGVTVTVKLVDGDGEQIAEKQARLNLDALSAGASANFRVLFAEVLAFADARFEIHSNAGAKVVGTPPPPPKTP